MVKRKYTTDKKEVYTLELQRLQRCLSDIQQVSSDASSLEKISWRHIEFLRQANFMLSQGLQLVEDAVILPG